MKNAFFMQPKKEWARERGWYQLQLCCSVHGAGPK